MLRLPVFDYLIPKTVEEAVKMHAAGGEKAMYVAGGTDLFPNMKRRHQEPATVITLSGISGLDEVGMRGGGEEGKEILSIGPSVTLNDLAAHPLVLKHYPALAQAASSVSTPALKNMGTIGGNLCLDTRCNYYNQSYEWRKALTFCMKKDGDICWVAPSSPRCWAVNSSDTAPVMVALGAEFVLAGPGGERTIEARSFYHDDGIDYLTKLPGEILKEIRLPQPNNSTATYHKLRRRGSFDFPVLGVAAWIDWDGTRVKDARIVLGAVASYPRLVTEAADAIRDTNLDDAAIAKAAAAAFKPSKPMDNTDFNLSWRKQMTKVYVRRALEQLKTA